MRSIRIITAFLAFSHAWAAELIIDTDSTVVEGGTYDMIEITARYVILRNVTVRNTTGENYYAAVYLNGCKYATVENCTIDGGAEAVRGNGSCGGIKLDGSSRVRILNNIIYNVNDDGIRMYYSALCDIIGNTIYTLLSCGKESVTDTGCSDCVNGHSDGFQPIACTKVNFCNNFIYDVRGNAALMMGNHPDMMCRFITMANNILYTPEAGYTAYLNYGQDFDLVNNVILGGNFGSIWYGRELYAFRMQNNVCGMIKLKDGGTYDASQHTVSHNLYCELHPNFNYGTDNIIEQDPQFTAADWDGSSRTPSISDFTLAGSSPCRDAGVTGDHIPDLDVYGLGRNGAPDIGAIEYGGVTGITSYSSLPVLSDLRVYPYPMRDLLTFDDADLQNGEINLAVFSMEGVCVHEFQGKGTASVMTWDGTHEKPGMYTYQLTVDGVRRTGVIFKTR